MLAWKHLRMPLPGGKRRQEVSKCTRRLFNDAQPNRAPTAREFLSLSARPFRPPTSRRRQPRPSAWAHEWAAVRPRCKPCACANTADCLRQPAVAHYRSFAMRRHALIGLIMLSCGGWLLAQRYRPRYGGGEGWLPEDAPVRTAREVPTHSTEF